MQITQSRPSGMIDYNQIGQCRSALQQVNVTNVEKALGELLTLLEGMAVASPEPSGHLAILEEARQGLDFVAGEAAKRYASRPLPPSSAEEEVLQRVTRLWSIMATNYGFVARRAALSSNPVLADQRTLLTQRRIQYHALCMIEYFRARREMPTGYWQDLHAQYLTAERAGVAEIRVLDPLNEIWGAQSTKECYVAMLLIDAASPYSRTPREFLWLVRWAQRFAPYCLLRAGVATEEKNSTFVLDMESDAGLRPVGPAMTGTQLFSLNTTKLATHIQAVVNQLKKGVSAASLGLGEDCVQPACARLLVSLYRPWGMASSGRRFPRRHSNMQAQVCIDNKVAAFFLTGQEYLDEGRPKEDFTRTEAMLTLGERVQQVDMDEERLDVRAIQLGYVLETWDIVDQSVAGFRMVRQHGQSRIEHRQLIGLRIPKGEKLLLAEISWLQYRQDGSLSAGISILPGPPTVATVRIVGTERIAIRDQQRLGFIIPPVPALKTEISMLVPAGWFQAERRISVQAEGMSWVARIDKLVSRGSNFDRVSFVRDEAPAVPVGAQ